MGSFLKKHGMDGFELIQYDPWDPSQIPSKLIKGLHMRFWASWLDFWRMDVPELEKQFGNMDRCREYYGGPTAEAMVDYYREELHTALKMGVEYVVFHVSHVRPIEGYTYRFSSTDEEVAEAFIQLLNKALEGFEGNFDILFENQWWPGLTLTDKRIPKKLMKGIQYPHKGFVLDISHMMNTNLDLKSEEEASRYILSRLDSLEEIAAHIKGIHLNSSLSGEYVKNAIRIVNNGGNSKDKESIWEEALYHHISKIDSHTPFTHPSIKRVIDRVNPKYLVYELLAPSLPALEEYIEEQNRVLGTRDERLELKEI